MVIELAVNWAMRYVLGLPRHRKSGLRLSGMAFRRRAEKLQPECLRGAAGVAGPYRAFIWESFGGPDERSAAVYKRTAAKAGAAMENSGCLCGNRK